MLKGSSPLNIYNIAEFVTLVDFWVSAILLVCPYVVGKGFLVRVAWHFSLVNFCYYRGFTRFLHTVPFSHLNQLPRYGRTKTWNQVFSIISLIWYCRIFITFFSWHYHNYFLSNQANHILMVTTTLLPCVGSVFCVYDQWQIVPHDLRVTVIYDNRNICCFY